MKKILETIGCVLFVIGMICTFVLFPGAIEAGRYGWALIFALPMLIFGAAGAYYIVGDLKETKSEEGHNNEDNN